MMRLLIVLLFVAVTTASLAQQQKQSMQDQVALSYSSIGLGVAKQLDAANARIEKLTAEIKTLRDRCEPEKK